MPHRPRDAVLVTGGAGFIGSHLCARLLSHGADVLCVDNLSTGRAANVEALLGHPRFQFVQHDVTEPFDAKVKQIYNLACPASPRHYQEDPVKTLRSSVLGAMNMLELARRCGARILQASTSEIYGDPLVHPQSESYWGNVNPTGARSCYVEGKRCAETLFSDYRRQYGVDSRIARIFNTYGPKLLPDDGRVVSAFITQAMAGKPITIFGSGHQTRTLCFVDDLVEALVLMMRNPSATGPLNFGGEEEISINQLAGLILGLTASKSEIVHHELPEDDPCRRRPDISLAKTLLDWRPKTKVVDGLERTIRFFRDDLPTRVAESTAGQA